MVFIKTIEYLVKAHGIIERGTFYNYIHEKGYKDTKLQNREYMINSKYPFGLVTKRKKLLVIESATNCFLMQKSGKMKTVEEIKEILGD